MWKKMSVFWLMVVLAQNVCAWEVITGKVTNIEASYMPKAITFFMDAGSATCATNRRLRWGKPDIENNKAIYSTLMTALVSGKTISLYVTEGDTTCTGQFLYIK